MLVTLAPPAPCFLDVTVAAVDANATAAGNTKVKVQPHAAESRPGGCCSVFILSLGITPSLTNRVFLCTRTTWECMYRRVLYDTRQDAHSCPTQRLRVQVTSLMVSEDTAVDRILFTPLGSTDAEGNNTV